MACYGSSSRLGFYAITRSKVTTPNRKPPIRNLVSIVNHINNVQSSKFTSSSNLDPTRITNVSSFSSLIVDNGSDFRRFTKKTRNNNVSSLGVLAGIGIRIGTGSKSESEVRSIEKIPFTKREHEIRISHKSERAIGEDLFKQMKGEFKDEGITILPKMSPESVRVRKILKAIIEALHVELKKQEDLEGVKWASSHLEGLKWEVLVVKKNDVVQAECIPGGKIFVYTGLLDLFKTDEEIATIIAHEVAHVLARHGVEKLTKMRWFTPVIVILSHFVKEDGVKILCDLLSSPFSRRMEIEADYIGLLLMAYAGYDPLVAPKVFEKLDQVCGDSALQDYFCTHPSGKTRSVLLSKDSVMQQAISIYQEAIRRRKVDNSWFSISRIPIPSFFQHISKIFNMLG